jgi:hypothetical protein
MLKTAQLFASLLLLLSLCSCHRSPSEAKTKEQKQKEAADIIRRRDQLEAKAQEEAAKIQDEREHRAEVQQQQREKVAADIAKRTDTREATRAANLERAAAEQARRERITSELAKFIDTSWIQIMRTNTTEELRINSQPVRPGSVIVSPAGYSVTYTGHDGDDFSFTYDQDAAFTLTFKRPYDGLSLIAMKAKRPLADGFEIDQPLPDFGSIKPRTPSSLPDSPATPQRNLFDGTWVGTINGRAGLVKFTIVISGGGTVWSATSKLRPEGGGTRDATNDGKAMTWYWGVQNKTLVTFTPNPDGKTAVMMQAGPAIAGTGAFNASATFHRTLP